MKKRKYAFSTMGFAIVLVIILGIVMIISAPMMADKYKDKTPKNSDYDEKYSSSKNEQEYYDNKSSDNISYNYDRLEREISRTRDDVSALESRILNQVDFKFREEMQRRESSSSVSDRYVCSIEGYLDVNGNVVPVNSDSNSDRANDARTSLTKKFVFVCQYNK